ncbi:MAG: response regulator transcription factor [Clostridia bacterium]|nr:response regulator transcription factor [Clostridia bacterium]
MIYCVEDDPGIRDIELYTLKSTGFEAVGFTDGEALTAAIAQRTPALILLDVMLPGDDGYTVLEHLRTTPATKDIPVIMATAKGMEYDKIRGLDSGADDYLVKPFGMMEMVSRVRAVLRRCRPQTTESAPKGKTLSVGGLVVNDEEHTVTVDGTRVVLTYKEYELLRLFLTRPGVAFTRDMLFNDIWGMDFCGETRTVDMHIRTLRAKLGDYGVLIETVRGVGYRFDANHPLSKTKS